MLKPRGRSTEIQSVITSKCSRSRSLTGIQKRNRSVFDLLPERCLLQKVTLRGEFVYFNARKNVRDLPGFK